MEELATEMVLLERGSSTTRISFGSVNLTGQVASSAARGDKRGRIVCALKCIGVQRFREEEGRPSGEKRPLVK
jgi:hypothetical protein